MERDLGAVKSRVAGLEGREERQGRAVEGWRAVRAVRLGMVGVLEGRWEGVRGRVGGVGDGKGTFTWPEWNTCGEELRTDR